MTDTTHEERYARAKLAMRRIMTDAVHAMFDDEDICFASLKGMADRYDHALTLIQSYARGVQEEHLEWRRGGGAA
jgi:hypothetical protein